jgi:predicted SAM-dependent methyltransferase
MLVFPEERAVQPSLANRSATSSSSLSFELLFQFGFSLDYEDVNVNEVNEIINDYLSKYNPAKIELGAGVNWKPGWLETDLYSKKLPDGTQIIALDVRNDFPIPENSFDFIYCEHMMEHLTYKDGQHMLEKCHRILKPDGVIRIVTPSIGFLSRIISADLDYLARIYRDWSVRTFVPDAPAVTNAFFLNNFMRSWGHTFLYDHQTLVLALELGGFSKIRICALNESEHADLRGIENEKRLPPGFLAIESMVLEATKARRSDVNR